MNASAVWLLFVGSAVAQQLTVTSSSQNNRPGDTATLLLRIQSNPAKPVSAMQWELVSPPSILFAPREFMAGASAASASKTLACAEVEKASRYRCLVAGDREALRDGVVAILLYRIPSKARAGAYPFSIRNVIGTSPAGQSVPIPGVESTIRVR